MVAARISGFAVDIGNTNQILDISRNQSFCGPYRSSVFQTNGFPRLKASSGSRVIAEYLENGHISSPLSINSTTGDIYWLGRTRKDGEYDDQITFTEVHGWTRNRNSGRGGICMSTCQRNQTALTKR